ncbi:MAG: cytochrome c3 family protein [Methanocella sp.]
MALHSRAARRAAGVLWCLLAAVSVAGCVDAAYLAAAKDRYETRHRLKKYDSAGSVADAAGDDQKKSHPPYRDRECAKCHDQGRSGELLAEGEGLCWLCHDRTKFRPERQHGPVAVGACSDCHISHENAFPYHTTSALPGLCLKCHAFAWGGKDGFVSGFGLHQPVKEGKCARCHDPHGGSRRLFLKADPAELCLTCHDPEVYGGGVVHGPLAVGDCLACHDPHAAKAPHLLREAFDAALCFRCHTQPRVKCPARPDDLACLRCHNPHRLTGTKTTAGAQGVAK